MYFILNVFHYIIFMQCKLELHDNGGTVDHGTAFGRIAFSCPREQVRYYFMVTFLCLIIFEKNNHHYYHFHHQYFITFHSCLTWKP